MMVHGRNRHLFADAAPVMRGSGNKLQTNTALLRTFATQADDDDSASSAFTRKAVSMPVIRNGRVVGSTKLPVLRGRQYAGFLDDLEAKAKAAAKAAIDSVTGSDSSSTPAETHIDPAGQGSGGKGGQSTPTPSSGIPKYALYAGAGILGLGLAYYLSQP